MKRSRPFPAALLPARALTGVEERHNGVVDVGKASLVEETVLGAFGPEEGDPSRNEAGDQSRGTRRSHPSCGGEPGEECPWQERDGSYVRSGRASSSGFCFERCRKANLAALSARKTVRE